MGAKEQALWVRWTQGRTLTVGGSRGGSRREQRRTLYEVGSGSTLDQVGAGGVGGSQG